MTAADDNGRKEPTRASAFPGFDSVSDDSVALIDRLTEVRQARGLSQTEVAARMGTSQSALARLESGRSDVRLSTLDRYARALDLDLGFAIRDRSDQDPNQDQDQDPARDHDRPGHGS